MKGNTHNKSKLLVRSKGSYGKLIIFAIGAVLALILLYFAFINQFLGASDQRAEEITTQTEELIESAEVAAKNFNVGPEPLTVPLKAQLANEELLENSYLSFEKKTPDSLVISKSQTKKCSWEGFNDYKRFLDNANQLVIKLYEGLDYGQELTKFKTIIHPQEIQVILENFDNFLVKNGAQDQQVIYPLGGFVSHFITVTKKKETITARKTREQLIENNMQPFIEYLYSDILQEKFVKCQNF
jgi:hypothetical protein